MKVRDLLLVCAAIGVIAGGYLGWPYVAKEFFKYHFKQQGGLDSPEKFIVDFDEDMQQKQTDFFEQLREAKFDQFFED